MKRLVLRLYPTWIFVLFFTAVAFPQPSRHYTLSSLWIKTCEGIMPVDFDQDGRQELFMDVTSQINILDSRGEHYLASFVKTGFMKNYIIPIPTGSLDSLAFFISHQTPNGIHYDLWHPAEKPDKTFLKKNIFFFPGKDVDGDNQIHLTFKPVFRIPYRHRSFLNIIILDSSKDCVRRGMMATLLPEGKIVWEFLFGPQIANIQLTDVNRDNRPELLISTYAPDNGAEWNGFPDDSSYVFFVDALNGQLLWSRKLGGIFTSSSAVAGDMTGDGVDEIVAWRSSVAEPEDGQDFVALLDPHDGHILQKRSFGEKTPRQNFHCNVRDIDQDGKKELVLGNFDGLIRVFNEDLNVEQYSRNFHSAVQVHQITDLDGDGNLEILASTADKNYHILDTHLQPLYTIPLKPYENLITIKGSRRSYLIQTAPNPQKDDRKLIVHLLQFRKASLLQRERQIPVFFLFGILFVLTLWVTRNLYFKHYLGNMLTFFLTTAGVKANLLILNKKGEIREIGENIARFFELSREACLGKKPRECSEFSRYPEVTNLISSFLQQRNSGQTTTISITTSSGEITLKVSYFFLPLFNQHYLQFIDLSEQEYIRRVKTWAPVAQRMAHGIKNPLTSVKLNAEELKDILKEKYQATNGELDEYLESIISQVEKLSRISDRFMRFVRLEAPQLQPVQVNQRIPELISQWKPEQSAVKIEYQLQPDLPPALLDPEQFEFVLKTVFYNALESIEGKGRILIATREVQIFPEESHKLSERFIEIEITDTGCGIPPELLPKVGEPYFSTKVRGTGLGISIVKKIMEEHLGTFEIHSEENVGSTVLLRFRPAVG